MTRCFLLSGGGFSAATLLTALWAQNPDFLSVIAVGLLAGAIPCWVVVAIMVEIFISIGEVSYPFAKSKEWEAFLGGLLTFASFGLLGGFSLLVWRFSISAAIALIVSIVICFLLYLLFTYRLDRFILNAERGESE